MKDVLPNFQINIAFRTVKIAKLFSRSGKPDRLPTFETPDTNYHFICDCGADYVGMCKRPLNTRIRDHQQQSKAEAIFYHKAHCEIYKKSLAKIKRENSYQYLKPAQKTSLVYEYFRSHFKILASSFRNYFERINTEAYFIKTLRPSLNVQKDEKFFVLYSKMGTPKFVRKKKP